MDISDAVDTFVKSLRQDGHTVEYGNSNGSGTQICVDGLWILIRTM